MLWATRKVPALIAVAPVKVLAPDKVQVPAPALVKVPLPVPTILAKLPPCAPPSVKPNPDPVIVPVWVISMVPLPPTTELALPKVIKPE